MKTGDRRPRRFLGSLSQWPESFSKRLRLRIPFLKSLEAPADERT